LTISSGFIFSASSIVFPFASSHIISDAAIAAMHPNVLNLISFLLSLGVYPFME